MQQKNNIQLNFTGDISFTGVFESSIHDNSEIFDNQLLETFNRADFNIVNLEGPATNQKTYLRNNGLVTSPYESIKYLKERNITVFNLANNHLFDNGLEGYKDTIRAIKEVNGYQFGGGLNLTEASKATILTKGNVSIAMIAVCHKEGMIADKNSAGIFCIEKNLKLIHSITAELKQKYDWVILNYHGGEEYTQIPMPSRKKLLRKLTHTKADIIIAHHSHVFQGYETYNEKPIFYSLGNFVFDIPPHKNINFIEQTAILNFNFTKTDFEYSFKPVVISIENKKIVTGDPTFIDTIKKISQKIYTNYPKHWRAEAHRTFFHANKKTTTNSSNQTHTLGKRHQSVFQLIFKFDTIYKFYKLLKSKNKRPLFLGAIAYKILK